MYNPLYYPFYFEENVEYQHFLSKMTQSSFYISTLFLKFRLESIHFQYSSPILIPFRELLGNSGKILQIYIFLTEITSFLQFLH